MCSSDLLLPIAALATLELRETRARALVDEAALLAARADPDWQTRQAAEDLTVDADD